MASEDESPPPAAAAVATDISVPAAGATFWTSEFDGVRVGPTCHIQKAESRFGPHVSEDIKNFVFEDVGGGTQITMDLDDEDEEEEEEEEVDDLDYFGNVIFEQVQASDMIMTWPWLQSWLEENVPIPPPIPPPETSPDFQGGPTPSSFPKMARLRCNLTALSQRYNLYFAAYQDKIYIYQPKAPPEILPGPSIILQPKRTRAARTFGGVIDRVFPHQINNMVVGNLGKLEVVLFAYDDGDVGAYYTHSIVRAILANDEQRRGQGVPGARSVIPKQFFCENVGQSAWGVAIHEKSRLLAVSSNRHEVTVWAFALTRPPVRQKRWRSELDVSPKVWSGQTAMELERHFRSRTRTWRIILPIGQQGHNIPTIAFADNERGEADKVVALDINDNTWILDIWKIGGAPVVYPGALNRGMPTQQRLVGWGVLVLPDSSFMQVKSVREAVGVPRDQIIDKKALKRSSNPDRPTQDIWLDTTCSLYYVKDIATDPESDLRNRFGYTYSNAHSNQWHAQTDADIMDAEQSEDEVEDEMEDETDISEHFSDSESADSENKSSEAEQQVEDAEGKRWASLSEYPGPKGSVIDDLDKDIHLSRVIIPSFGQTPHLDSSPSSLIDLVSGAPKRQTRSKPVNLSHAQLPEYMKNLSILRATTTDIELISLDPSCASIHCKSVITYHNHHRRRVEPYDLQRHISERISMLIHVPELNLVVAGALNGRVALMTLTKTKANVHGRPLRRGFRLDYVLPRKSEEEKRMRPWCTLHGIAVSPVPGRHATGLDLMDDNRAGNRISRQPLPLRYRLILHYLDHTILMYDIEKRGHDMLIF